MQYETDEEKVEAIKRWWKENGVSIIAGVAIGLGAILGWRAWTGHQESQAQQASATFEQLLAMAEAEDAAPLKLAERLRDDFAGTPYAALGSLILARIALERDDVDGAKEALEQVIADPPDPSLTPIAALRLARILIDQQDLDGAIEVISAHEATGPFAGEFAMLRGDIATAKGEVQTAREAYQAALGAGVSQAQLVEIKLANLPAPG